MVNVKMSGISSLLYQHQKISDKKHSRENNPHVKFYSLYYISKRKVLLLFTVHYLCIIDFVLYDDKNNSAV